MAERNPKLKKHRDGLETIINRAMEFVEESANTRRAREQGLPAQSHSTGEQPMHHTSPHGSLESQAQQFVPDNLYGTTTELFDIHTQGLFPGFQDFPMQLNDGLTAGSPSVLHPFQGIFTEDFWTGDTFNVPMLEGFNWRI
jgi:hypothetical protein